MSIALNSALTGLKAAQSALDTISSNIANAQTAGYTRKILPQETQAIGGIAVGVKIGTLQRNVDTYLVKDIFKQQSVSTASTTTSQFLSQIQTFHGSSDAQTSIANSLSDLQASFESLSSSPDSQILLNNTLSQAQATAKKFNDFSTLLDNMRTQTEDQITTNVASANAQIAIIADLNVKIDHESAAGQSIADLQDKRDTAVRELSKYVEVSSYPSENGKVVIQTKQGQVLADESAHNLIFQSSQVLPGSYPGAGGLSGLSIQNTSSTIPVNQTAIGGSIGALFTLRDNTLPTYIAQNDELAQKMASRFDQAGLRLFTDTDGTVPASTTPPTPVSYVGFAGRMQVNAAIVNDPTLLRSGTNGDTVLSGSNEVISKVAEYTFGATAYQQATGSVSLTAGLPFAGGGLNPTNKVIGNIDLTDYTPNLSTAPNITFPATFNATINGSTQTITVNATDTATSLVNNINTAFGSTVAALNGLGQLTLSGNSGITLADNTIGAAGMASLGLSFGTTAATNPSFTVQVGTQSPVTVNIAPGETTATLMSTLNAIPGLSATLNAAGQLVMKPKEGGALTLNNASGTPLTALGLTMSNVPHDAFRSASLGGSGTLSTGLLGSSTIGDFARSMISSQSEDASVASDAVDKESSFLTTLDARNSNQSGVDIDQELSELVRIQTAYSAAGRMVSATEKMMDDLFTAFFN